MGEQAAQTRAEHFQCRIQIVIIVSTSFHGLCLEDVLVSNTSQRFPLRKFKGLASQASLCLCVCLCLCVADAFCEVRLSLACTLPPHTRPGGKELLDLAKVVIKDRLWVWYGARPEVGARIRAPRTVYPTPPHKSKSKKLLCFLANTKTKL